MITCKEMQELLDIVGCHHMKAKECDPLFPYVKHMVEHLSGREYFPEYEKTT